MKQKMSHLTEVNKTYFQHLIHAWSIAGILIIHGILPDIWKTKASDLLHKRINRL
jgi:hypothetical protein